MKFTSVDILQDAKEDRDTKDHFRSLAVLVSGCLKIEIEGCGKLDLNQMFCV